VTRGDAGVSLGSGRRARSRGARHARSRERARGARPAAGGRADTDGDRGRGCSCGFSRPHAAAGAVGDADDAPARHTGAIGHAARPGVGGGRRAGRRRARRESRRGVAHAARVRRGASRSARALSAHVFAAVPGARRRRCGNRAAGRRARAPGRLSGSSGSAAAEGRAGAVLSGDRHRHCLRGHRRTAGLRGSAGGFGLPAKPADVALAHAGADRDERVLPRDGMAVAWARRRCRGGVSACQSKRGIPRALACVAAALSDRRQAGAQPRFGALREHARHPGGQRRTCAKASRCRAR